MLGFVLQWCIQCYWVLIASYNLPKKTLSQSTCRLLISQYYFSSQHTAQSQIPLYNFAYFTNTLYWDQTTLWTRCIGSLYFKNTVYFELHQFEFKCFKRKHSVAFGSGYTNPGCIHSSRLTIKLLKEYHDSALFYETLAASVILL